MNRVEAESRALRYLAVIRYQLELMAINDLYVSRYSETAVLETLNAATKMNFRNLNDTSPNFPAIDLLSADGTVGIQATRRASKAKYDKTLRALRTTLDTTTRLTGLREVQVVGIDCVRNKPLQEWHTPQGAHGVRFRIIALDHLLALRQLDMHRLTNVERAAQGLASTLGPQLNSDSEELAKIAAFLDRPAIRDRRHLESSWGELAAAMSDVRRLLSQGVSPTGVTITRGWQTFQPPIDFHLKAVYDASHSISRLVQPHLQSRGSLSPSDERLIDGHRLQIQEHLTAACMALGVVGPSWD